MTTRLNRIKVSLSNDEKSSFERVAKEKGISVSQLCRLLVAETRDKKMNDTAQTIDNLTKTIDERMLEFAKANDIATSFLINNLSNLYENKLEKLQKKVDSMAPYFQEAQRIIAAREAVLRKQRAKKRVLNAQSLQQ